MVDRYVICASKESFAEQMNITTPKEYKEVYNAAPTKLLPITTMQNPKEIELFKWGLIPNLSNNKKLSPKLFNLNIDQALTKPSHKKSILSNRCIIWANGFYIWKPIARNRTIPHYVHLSDTLPKALAGIWEAYETFEDEVINSFMMITLRADSQISDYQEDMPLILEGDLASKWLNYDLSIEDISGLLLENTTPPFKIHPVSPAIRNIDLDSRDLIMPSNPADQYGNYTLFG